MDILEKLFGSGDRVRIMRMFLFNPDAVYTVEQISGRTTSNRRVVDRELALLQKAGMLRRKPFSKYAKDGEGAKLRGNGWALNRGFRYLRPLENLLIQQALISEADIIKRLERVGKLKLVVMAGIFIQDPESRVDILVVSEHMKKKTLIQIIRELESEIGKELRYAAFETPEFEYRVGMYDKLVRDIFEFPHRKILDKIGLLPKTTKPG
jgi:hypothetical protein